jgi:hypothetical protein
MPPRWPRQPDRNDPAYRRLDDRMTFATHVAIFAAINSGLWFLRVLDQTSELSIAGGLPWAIWVTGAWGLGLAAHAVFIVAIARYDDQNLTANSKAGVGFKPRVEKTSAKSAKR